MATAAGADDARPYHHGDLPRALLEAAVEAIEEVGPAALSLRDLARRTGVSHAAPAHHFGDKAGLLTAVAADGFRRLAATLGEAYRATGSFLEVGVAYARFAVTHRGGDELRAAVAAWSLVHGLVTLWLNHNLPPQLGDDPEQLVREVARYLF